MTSFDIIYLLKALVTVRFPTEEKNRIRRNLESFRSTTMYKDRSDSEDLYKTIMKFTRSKLRNIEKEVKVFSWRTLDHALKKIIEKYVSLSALCEKSECTDMSSLRATSRPSASCSHQEAQYTLICLTRQQSGAGQLPPARRQIQAVTLIASCHPPCLHS